MAYQFQVDLVPAIQSDVRDILRINWSYFPHESLQENVKETAEKDLGVMISKFTEQEIDTNLTNFLVIVQKENRQVVGYIQSYR